MPRNLSRIVLQNRVSAGTSSGVGAPRLVCVSARVDANVLRSTCSRPDDDVPLLELDAKWILLDAWIQRYNW